MSVKYNIAFNLQDAKLFIIHFLPAKAADRNANANLKLYKCKMLDQK